MLRSTALALAPAGAAWGALLDLAAHAQLHPDAALAYELASTAVPQRLPPRQRARSRVPAGRLVEVLAGARRGAPLLEPAAGALHGVDEAGQGIAVYRVQAAGSVAGRAMAEGALVMLARRRADRGELVAVIDHRSIRLCVAGAVERGGVPAEGRVLGVVEAVVGAAAARRCA